MGVEESLDPNPRKGRESHKNSRGGVTTDESGEISDDSRPLRSHYSKKSSEASLKSCREQKRHEKEKQDLEVLRPGNNRYRTAMATVRIRWLTSRKCIMNNWLDTSRNGWANCWYRWICSSFTLIIPCQPCTSPAFKMAWDNMPFNKMQQCRLHQSLWNGQKKKHWWQECHWNWNRRRKMLIEAC